jgi:hypothetical protein
VDAADGLHPHERRVLDRVRDVAVRGVSPLSAITFRDADQAAGWVGGFATEVAADARALGLTRRFLLLSERRTPAGREVVARWRGLKRFLRADEAFAALPPAAVAVWGRHLAYGHALGLTRTCAAVIDLGAADRRRDHRRRRHGPSAPRPAVLAAAWAGIGCAVLRCASAVRGPWPEAGHLPERVSAGLQILGAVLLALACSQAARTIALTRRPSRPVDGEPTGPAAGEADVGGPGPASASC